MQNDTRRNPELCRWALYSDACGVSEADHKHTGTVTAIDPDTCRVHVDLPVELEADWAKHGFLSAGERVPVLASTAGALGADGECSHELTLGTWPSGIELGATVQVLAGCDKTAGTCKSKFDNIFCFGGLKLATGRNASE